MLCGMAIAVDTHVGPWSEEDLLVLPDSVQRYELLEGSLVVNPPPSVPHQRFSGTITGVLRDTETPGWSLRL